MQTDNSMKLEYKDPEYLPTARLHTTQNSNPNTSKPTSSPDIKNPPKDKLSYKNKAKRTQRINNELKDHLDTYIN